MATIKDIARLASVSHTTVSRALNGSLLISDETKNRIIDLSKQLGYTPNHFAKSLVMKKSFRLALFFTSLNYGVTSDYFFNSVKFILSKVKHKYTLMIRGIDDYKDTYNTINKNNVDGVIVVSQCSEDDAFIQYLKKEGIPQVIINRFVDDDEIDCVYSNEREIVRVSIESMIKKGLNRVAFVKGAENFYSTEERYQGYLDALKSCNVKIDDSLLYSGDFSMSSGNAAMKTILNKLGDNLPDSIFFSSDEMALGAINLIKSNNISIPSDMSIMGFDNSELSAYIVPGLTTIDRPVSKILNEGLSCLLARIDDKNMPHVKKKIDSKIIERGTYIF